MSRFSQWRETRATKKALMTLAKSAINKTISAGNGKTENRTNQFYRGGAGDKFEGGTSDYLGSTFYNHFELRGKSRKAIYDNPPMAAIQARKTQSVVDTGIQVDPAPNIQEIGMTETQAKDFIKFAKGFNDWMACKLQHRREQMTFFQAQALAQSEKSRDGEYFFRAFYNYEDELPHPLQWEALDADQFSDWGSTITQEGFIFEDTNTDTEYPQDGIIKDERGRPKEYVIWVNESGFVKEIKLGAKTAGGRYQIIHGFNPQYSFQTRGFPSNAGIMQDSKLLQDFSMANIQKAINQSQKVFAVENKNQDPTSPFDENAFMQALEGYFNANADGTATPTETGISYLNSPIFQRIALQTQPGSESLIMPEKGTTIKAIESTAPVAQYDLFVGAYFSFLAAAENVPVEVALMKFGQNYSASRAALIMYFRICETERLDMDADLISPFYEMYLAVGIELGLTSAPGWSDPRIRQMYLRHRIIGAPLPSIDPARESVASLNNLGTGATSLTRNAQNLNGSDVRKNIADNLELIAEVEKMRQGFGLNKSSGSAG